MSWTTPKTWTAVVVTVSDLNTHIRDNENILKTSVDDNGCLKYAYTAQTTTYNILSTDDVVTCNGTFTATLPTAVGKSGKFYNIKNIGTGTVTVATTSSQTIDGSTTYSLQIQYQSLTVVSDGSNWHIL